VLLAPNLKAKQIYKKTNQQSKTRNETNLDNTYTYFLLKNTQKTRGMRKKVAKEKGLESEMYVLALPHKFFKCLWPKPKTLCMFLLLFFSSNCLLTNQP
jgi:hypothetical protein